MAMNVCVMCSDLHATLSSSCTWWHLAASRCMWARRRWSSLVLSFVKRMKMRRIVLLFLVCKSKADSFNYTAYIGNKLFWRPLEAPILHSVVLIDWCLQRERERDSLSITFLVKKWCMRMCGLGRRKGRCSSRISKRNISLKFNPI